jgi:hypothetical protein
MLNQGLENPATTEMEMPAPLDRNSSRVAIASALHAYVAEITD